MHKRLIRGSIVRRAFCLVLLLLACSGDSSTGPTKWEEFPLFPASGVVEDELEVPGSVVSYRLEGWGGRPVRLLFQARSGDQRDNLVAELVYAETNWAFAYVFSRGTDTDLHGQASKWYNMPPPSKYFLRVRGVSGADKGPFTLKLATLDSLPETLDPQVVVGDTVVGEAIEVPGDVDEFSFMGEAGRQLVVFFQALSGSSTDELSLEVIEPNSDVVIGQVVSKGSDPHLETQSTQRFILPGAGPFTIRIASTVGADGDYTSLGAYRFFVYQVEAEPESAPATVALGDTSAIEAIDVVGDVDEFTFSGEAGTELNIFLEAKGSFADGLELSVLDGDSEIASARSAGDDDSLDRNHTGAFVLPHDGEYRIRVSGAASGAPAEATGPYRFELYKIDRRPEVLSRNVQIGGEYSGERIDRPGDIDEFHLTLTEPQLFNIFFATTDPQPSDPFILEFIRPDGVVQSCARPPGESNWARNCRIGAVGRFSMDKVPGTWEDPGDREVPGTYILRVRGVEPKSSRTGSYRFEIRPIDTAPESVAPELPVGVWVTGEALDFDGDLDEFYFTGTEGDQIVIFPRPGDGFNGYPYLWVYPPSDTLRNTAYTLARSFFWQPTHRFLLPERGRYAVQIEIHQGGGGEVPPMPYELLVHKVDPAPESAPARYVIGDTITGEAIYPAGDIDEFVFDAVAGERFEVIFKSGEDTSPLHAIVSVVDGESGELLAGYSSDRDLVRLFIPPRTGPYILRVSTEDNSSRTGPYLLALIRW